MHISFSLCPCLALKLPFVMLISDFGFTLRMERAVVARKANLGRRKIGPFSPTPPTSGEDVVEVGPIASVQ